MLIESETFEFIDKAKERMLVQGVIDGRLRTVESEELPYGFVRDVDFISRMDDFKRVDKTELKVKYHNQEYNVFRFDELEPKLIGRKAKELEKIGVPTFETDVPYKRRIFVDEKFKTCYKNRVLYLDFEMDDSQGFRDYGKMPFLSSAMGINGSMRYTHVSDFNTEKEFLEDAMGFLKKSCKTVLVGFNTKFDVKHLKGRCQQLAVGFNWLNYCFPYDMRESYKREVKGLTTYSLEEVANYEKIGTKHRKKKICEMTKPEIEEYNKNDVALLMALEKKYGFVKTDTALQEFIGLPMSMSSAYVRGDTLVLRRLRELGYVAINAVERTTVPYEGGFVKEPSTGLHKDVINLDALSLYPTVIVQKNIDIEDFNGAVIPYLVKMFMKMKDEATERGDNVARSVAKVSANAMYGLFGFGLFRYYERAKAEAVAREGRFVVQDVLKVLSIMGIDTKYADTDSAFLGGDGISKEQLAGIVQYINSKINPYEVKVDHRFSQIIFYRKNSGEPSKKRYVGIDEKGAILARGVELRRSDWCPLAKRNLLDCVMAVFDGKKAKDVREHMSAVKKQLFAGQFDDELIIKKGLKEDRKYKVATPQMKVYEKGLKKKIYTGSELEVSYYFSSNGEVEPWTDGAKSFDYAGYYEKQLMPPITRLLLSIDTSGGKQQKLII